MIASPSIAPTAQGPSVARPGASAPGSARIAVSCRDISVEIRTEQGNKLYEEMIKLCNIGKDVWVDKDPVKYAQYCVYDSNNDQKIARKQRLAAEA